MDWYKLVEGEISKGVASVIAMVFIMLVAFLRKLPRDIVQKIREKRHISAFQRDGKVSAILSDLSRTAGTIYVVIWRYHNGKSYHKMSVDWEVPGTICDNCVANCRNHNNIPRLQELWQDIPITDLWRETVINKTISARGDVVTTNYKDLDKPHQDLWNDAKIHVYKECLIKYKSYGMLTLGLSFCVRFKDYDAADGVLRHAAVRLKNLL